MSFDTDPADDRFQMDECIDEIKRLNVVIEKTLDLFRSAQANFDNFVISIPVIKESAIYQVARIQLDMGVERLEKREGSPDEENDDDA